MFLIRGKSNFFFLLFFVKIKQNNNVFIYYANIRRKHFFLSKYALNANLKLLIKVIHWRKWAMFLIRGKSKLFFYFSL